MESESTEIDFRSLEDELYDNEITQILSQPNTAESMYTDWYFFFSITQVQIAHPPPTPQKRSDGQ